MNSNNNNNINFNHESIFICSYTDGLREDEETGFADYQYECKKPAKWEIKFMRLSNEQGRYFSCDEDVESIKSELKWIDFNWIRCMPVKNRLKKGSCRKLDYVNYEPISKFCSKKCEKAYENNFNEERKIEREREAEEARQAEEYRQAKKDIKKEIIAAGFEPGINVVFFGDED